MTRLSRIVAVMMVALIATANVALADDLIADGDGVEAVGNNDLTFGNICRGVSTSKPVAVALKRNGTGNSVYKDGSAVAVTASFSGSAGVTASDPGSITTPADWSTQSNNTMSPAAFGSVTVNTSTLGGISGTVTYTGTGINSSNDALVKSDKMTVSGTVVTCDTTPPETSILSPTPAATTSSTSAAFTYSSTESPSTFECKLDAGTFASCPAAGKSYSGLGEGSHTFQVRAIDSANNVDPTPASYTWTIDLTAPDTAIDSAPPALTNATSASFAYSSPDGASFECKLDGSSFASCPAAGKTYPGLAAGSHAFQVRALDAVGNIDQSPATHSWTIDLTAPDTTIVTGPPAASNADAASFTYSSSEAGSTFECSLDLGAFAACPADGTGYSGLDDGAHTFAVQAIDGAGNADSTAATYTWTVDTTPPAVSAPDLSDASDTGSSQIDDVTKDDTPTVTGTAEPGSTVELLRDGAAVDSMLATDGTWSFTSAALSEGTYDFSARATDAVGNAATSPPLTVVVDMTAPVITPASRLPAANAAGWNTSAVTVTWSCSDALSGPVAGSVSDVKSGEGAGQTADGVCSDVAGNSASASLGDINIDMTAPVITASAKTADDVAYTAGIWTNQDVTVSFECTDGLSGVASVTGPSTVGEGADQSVPGSCTDRAGNAAATSFSDIDVDQTEPAVSASATTADATPYVAGTWTNQTVTVTFDCTDALSGVASLIPPSTTLSAEGADQSASAACTDNAGNSAGSSFEDVDIDVTGPVITASATRTDLSSYAAGTWTNQDVTVSFDCTDALSGVANVSDAATVGEGADQSVPGSCTDNAGNSAATSFDDIDVDKTAPVISLSSRLPAANPAGWNNSAVTVTWTCTDALSGPLTGTVSDTRSGQGTGQSASGTCADLAGNTASASVSGIDIDLTDPYGIAWVGGPAEGGAYHFGFVPAGPTCTATDDFSGMDSCSVTGYGATVGSHTMTATAFDRAGNDATATRSYSVLAWTMKGFYSPVDMNGIWNTVKGGSTVPLKWEMFAGSTELTDTSLVSLDAKQIGCTGGSGEDAVELTATGGTILRYEGGQFIYNWQTPKKPGTCYRVTMAAADGSTLVALFKLK